MKLKGGKYGTQRHSKKGEKRSKAQKYDVPSLEKHRVSYR